MVDLRPILPGPARRGRTPAAGPGGGTRAAAWSSPWTCGAAAASPLQDLAAAPAAGSHRATGCPWRTGGRAGDSCIWGFNALYWSALELWEKASGRQLRAGAARRESDARNHGAARELITGAVRRLGPARRRRTRCPPELYVAELGVGNGTQAKVFLDEFRALDRNAAAGYYRRLHYLMCDYSPYVLDLARETVVAHAEPRQLGASSTRPGRPTSLGFLRGKAFLLYISNVYDNLPTDEVAYFGGRPYYVLDPRRTSRRAAAAWRPRVGRPRPSCPPLSASCCGSVRRCSPRPRPSHFRGHRTPRSRSGSRPGPRCAWRNATCRWPGLDLYPLAPARKRGGTAVPAGIRCGHPDARQQRRRGQLHRHASRCCTRSAELVCHDLFVTEVQDYRIGFRGRASTTARW